MAADQPSRVNAIRKHLLWVCLLLALSTLAVYWPVTRHGFVNYDDTDYVTANPHVQAGLTAKGLAWLWHSEVARNWHPVTMVSHMLDCQLYGMRAGWHHLTSLLFHTANAVLLFLLLFKMTSALWRSGIVAALFALHPLHVESVAWIAERKDVLSTFFFLLTLGAYVAYVRTSQDQSHETERSAKAHIRHAKTPPPITHYWYACYWLAVLLFALGLMSKPMLVTVPFVLLLLDYWPLRRLERQSQGFKPSTWLPLVWEKLPFLALSAVSCVITYRVQHSGGAVLDVANLPMGARIANALMSYVRYLGKMVWPEGLAALYLRKAPWPAWEVGLAALALLAVTVVVLRLARRRPYLAMGWFWYLGTLIPVIGLVQVGMQTMADRYTYIPLIGIFIALAWGGCELANRWRVPLAGQGTATVLVLAACALLARKQLGWWATSETLFGRMIQVGEGNYLAHYNMGNLYSRQDKLADAAAHYEAALRSEPNYAEAHSNLGAVLLRQGRFDEALAHYATAVRLKPEYLYYFNFANAQMDAGRPSEAVPNYQHALRLNPNSSQAHHNLGMALRAQGQAEQAMAEFRAALRLQPDYESAEHHLANCLADAGLLKEAEAHYLAAVRLDPNHAENHNGLGICYAMQANYAEAERHFRTAVRLKPGHSGAQSNLGNALGAQNKREEAILHYREALKIDPGDPQTHFNLGLCLLQLGQRADARTHFAEALRLRPDYPEARKALAETETGAPTKK